MASRMSKSVRMNDLRLSLMRCKDIQTKSSDYYFQGVTLSANSAFLRCK